MSDAPANVGKPDLFDLLVAQEFGGRESGPRPSAASDVDAVMPLPAGDRVGDHPAASHSSLHHGRAVIAATADEEERPPTTQSLNPAPTRSAQTNEIDRPLQSVLPSASTARGNDARSVARSSPAQRQWEETNGAGGAREVTAPKADFGSREAARSGAGGRSDRHRKQRVERPAESRDAPSFGPSSESIAVPFASQVRPRADALDRLPSKLSRREPEKAEPTIEIHIGRLEVRAEPKPEAHRPVRKSDDSADRLARYLRRRSTGARS
jgi:hypothetical protein